MQLIYLAVLLTLCRVSCNVVKDDEPSHSVGMNDVLDDLLGKKCKKAGVKDAYKEFYKTYMTTMECMEKQYKPENNSDSSEELCAYVNTNVRECFKIVVENLQHCLEPEEKYLPKFIYDAFDKFLDLVCGDNFIELLASTSSATCFEELSKHNFFEACANSPLWKSLTDNEHVIFKKEKLCADMNELYDCRENVIKKTCTEDVIVRNLFNKLHKAISFSCDKEDEDKTT
ncbi:uncharacterized protein LOC116177393 [Photinus pyralis]|uniref:uncharacterized protein LOC116177393 n=1 Tax=Photinus pyralis TaxID=7054 RepID=UPI0012676089|nr:uncharacterized protein LOC116177393 [Photinus pyralis]